MRKQSKIVIGISAATISAAILLGANFTLAESNSGTLADRIAAKFNLNKTEVQKVVEDFHTEKKVEREKARSDELQKKVDAGTITESQKALIENKIKEMEAQREFAKDQNLTHEQMQAKMKTARDDLKKWATDNKIDLSLVMPFDKGGMRGGGMGGHGGPMGDSI